MSRRNLSLGINIQHIVKVITYYQDYNNICLTTSLIDTIFYYYIFTV